LGINGVINMSKQGWRANAIKRVEKTDDLKRGVHHRFENIIPGIRVRADKMLWPCAEATSEGQLYGNNLYTDFRGKTRLQAERVLLLEDLLIRRLEAVFRAPEFVRQLTYRQEEARVSRLYKVLGDLDLGTWAAVFAISAAGGVPVASCNGRSFGGVHTEPFPVVCFCWPPAKLPILRDCAKEAGVSMWLHHRGEVVIGANYIRRFLLFAQALLNRHDSVSGSDLIRAGQPRTLSFPIPSASHDPADVERVEPGPEPVDPHAEPQ
jgi:hypothetical protein